MRRSLAVAAFALAVVVPGGAMAAQSSLAAAAPRAAPRAAALPRSALAVDVGGEWRTWWRSDAAPARWTGPDATVSRAVRWTTVAPGVERGELRLAGSGEAWRLGIVLVRVDPARVRFALDQRTRDGGLGGAWAVDSAPATALLAFNAGQFSGGRAWGWLVRDGREVQPPGVGPLSAALVVDTAGRARLVTADSIAAVRARGGVALAVQSYPTILEGDGAVPAQLQAPGRGVDVGHRDSRLAVGELPDGRLLVALTRFEGLGGVLDELPFGPTVPEMAALLGALGARRAVLLDGGISGQLLLRAGEETEAWRGLRRVPVGMVVVRREAKGAGR